MKIFFVSIISSILLFTCSGKIEKVIVETYEDGNPKLVKFYRGENGHKEMIREITYYPSNQIRYEGAFSEGEKHGQWIYYYENGNKWSEGYFYMGERDGAGTTWHKNGQKYMHGSYNKGERTGLWQFWDENGKLDKEIDYNGE